MRQPLESAQYPSIRYSELVHEANIAASIGTVGDSYDNAMADALNGTYKAELVKLHGPWRTRANLETATINGIYWYNETRLHGEIEELPPIEYEQMRYTHNQPAATAGINN